MGFGFRFRLRTLFLGVLILGIVLAWWQHPYTLEESTHQGALTFQYRVRRGWNGKTYHHGICVAHYKNGVRATETWLSGVEVGTIDLIGEGVKTRYWDDTGRELVTFEDWFAFVALEYMGSQASGLNEDGYQGPGLFDDPRAK